MADDVSAGCVGGGNGGRLLSASSLDPQLLHLLRQMEAASSTGAGGGCADERWRRRTVREELRSVDFWRAVISECLAAFFCVFLVCGAHVPWPDLEAPSPAAVALASGFAMAALTHCFGRLSGGHVNPAVTVAMLLAKKVSPMGAALYVLAQCGGAIAGCALLFGVTLPGHQGSLGAPSVHVGLTAWQGFGVELVLTFVVAFTAFASLDARSKIPGGCALSVGAAYLACTFVGMPSTGAAMNPARALGPAFVMNRWKHHWVYWVAPLSGGVLAGLLYEYVFDPRKTVKHLKETIEDMDRAESSLHSQDEDYDEPEGSKTPATKMASSSSTYACRSQHYDLYRPRPPPPPLPQSTIGNGPSSALNTYTPGLQGGAEALYNVFDSHRPPSSCATYASIHGSRQGSLVRGTLHRMDVYSPDATKF